MPTQAPLPLFDPLMGLVEGPPDHRETLPRPVSAHDRRVLRDLAMRVADAAADPAMAERVALWKRHNALQPTRPLVLVFPEGAWRELVPWSTLRCETDRTRRFEQLLRCRIYRRDHIPDDLPLTDEWRVDKVIRNSGWGIEGRRAPSREAGGAYAFDPVLKDFRDLEKLRPPEIEYDEAATLRNLEEAQDLFADVLHVVLKGVTRIHFCMMYQLTEWRGLEETLIDFCANPGFVHEAMHRLQDGNGGLVRQYVEQNLLSLNNDGTYHGSGGLGWIDELPAPGFDPGRVRPRDLWASSEAQELTTVSPEMHEEFALQYERPLLEPFGLAGYGCCEDLTRKLDRVLALPNIRRVSVSPWADPAACGQQMGRRAILSWKVNPSHLVGEFDESFIGRYIADTLEATRENLVEVILKDTHTIENDPARIGRWTEIAKTCAMGR